MAAQRGRKKVVFLTADRLEEQANARASEAEQSPEGGARQNALRRQIEIIDAGRESCIMSSFAPDMIKSGSRDGYGRQRSRRRH